MKKEVNTDQELALLTNHKQIIKELAVDHMYMNDKIMEQIKQDLQEKEQTRLANKYELKKKIFLKIWKKMMMRRKI